MSLTGKLQDYVDYVLPKPNLKRALNAAQDAVQTHLDYAIAYGILRDEVTRYLRLKQRGKK